MRVTKKNEVIARISEKLLADLHELQEHSFEFPEVKRYIDNLDFNDMLYFAITLFVGSLSKDQSDFASFLCFLRKSKIWKIDFLSKNWVVRVLQDGLISSEGEN